MDDRIVITFKAGEDLSAAASQFKFVKLDTNGDVILCTATTDRPIGVLQNDPASGGAASVCVFGRTEVAADAAITLAQVLGTSADGQAAVYVAGTDTTKYLMGFAIRAAANAGERAEIFLTPIARGA